MADCNNKSKNAAMCNCSASCAKRGVCCECLAYHRDRGELPACYFSTEAERTWDRSIAHFVRLNS